MTEKAARRGSSMAALATLGIALGCLMTTSTPLYAQPAAAAPPADTTQDITVVAPRIVRRQVANSAPRYFGAPIEVLSTSRAVSFADLDLTSEAGADEFQKRILYAALAACDQMDSEYPTNVYVPVPASQNCPDDTARPPMQLADQIIRAARSQPK